MKTFLIGFCLVVMPCLALPTETQNIEIRKIIIFLNLFVCMLKITVQKSKLHNYSFQSNCRAKINNFY